MKIVNLNQIVFHHVNIFHKMKSQRLERRQNSKRRGFFSTSNITNRNIFFLIFWEFYINLQFEIFPTVQFLNRNP